MQRIVTLLQKISELAEKGNNSAIEIDLMMDHTRALYADLIEYRSDILSNRTVVDRYDLSTRQPQPDIEVNDADAPAYEGTYIPNTIELTIDHDPEMTAYAQQEQDDTDEDEDGDDAEGDERDIRTYIGINDKYQMISELFGNRKGLYESMIDQLNTFNTELEALKWLQDNMYFEFSWAEDSEALMILHATLHRFYNSN